MVLDDRARGQDGLRVARVVRERVAQKVEGLVVLAEAQVQQTDRREQLGVLGAELESFEVDLAAAAGKIICEDATGQERVREAAAR